jgi:phosphate-selective porin OprO/OprP
MATCVLALTWTAWAAPARADEALRAAIREELAKVKASDDAKTLRVYWDKGLKFEGKGFKGQIGGRLQFDTVFVTDKDFAAATGIAPHHSYVRFRRVRLANKGQIGKHVAYKVQIDFAGNGVGLKDVFIEYDGLRDCFGCGAPKIRVGHMYEPMSLDNLTSDNDSPFMEFSTPVNAFCAERNSGIMIHDDFRGGQMGYALGVFAGGGAAFTDPRASSGDADLEKDGYAVTGRVWWAPWYDCKCKCRRLHVGAWGSYRAEVGNLHFRTRPNPVSTGAQVIDTGVLNPDSAFLWGLEAAWVYGPWSVQGEFMSASLNASALNDPTFTGWYGQASYWLTGECRNWKGGIFHGTSPCCDWLDNDCCCKGAWELAVRYSQVDLNDGAVAGGKLTGWEVGLNWYLNANARIMFQFGSMTPEVRNMAGALVDNQSVTAFGMRYQVVF